MIEMIGQVEAASMLSSHAPDELVYMNGFGNEFGTEALPGTLPVTPTTYYYDAVESLYVALEAARSVQPDALQVVLETQDVRGVQGRIMRSNTDHSGYQPESAVRAVVADGALVPCTEELCAS